MNKKILTLTLAGVLALGGTVAAYATTNNTNMTPIASGTAVSETQSKEADDQDLNAANTGSIVKSDQGSDTAENDSVENETQDNGGDSDNIQHENDSEDPAGYAD